MECIATEILMMRLEVQLQAHQVPYLRLLINPDDDNAFLRCINTPRRKIGPSIPGPR